MAGRRRPLTGPGTSPQTVKRTLYIRLMKQGESNAAACRKVGINRKTGHRWLHGRTDTSADGRVKTYPSIMLPRRAISDRFLSESERVAIADSLVAVLLNPRPPARSPLRGGSRWALPSTGLYMKNRGR